jgi:hypothetical protein
MKKINSRLSCLYKLLFDLQDKQDDYAYWVNLEKAFRDYLKPRPEDEDAFNVFLLEVYNRSDHFVPTKGCKDSFCQKIYLIRLAYCNHKLKQKRSQIAEEIRILKYKEKKYDLTYEEMIQLQHLVDMKKKL